MIGVGVFAVVMGLLSGAMIARRDNHWPFAVALCGCAIGLGLAAGLSR